MSTYLASLQTGLADAFAADDHAYLLGEDVLDPYGGAFKVSKGLSTRYPDRVMTTPISEAGIVGVASGLALRGYRPVVEIMFGDFLGLCMDQLLNHATKFRPMYNDQVRVPLVVRTPMGGGRGYGATHSQSLEKLFLGIPGLTVVAPSHVHEPGTQLKRAILDGDGPVLFIENKLLYPMELATGGGGLSVRREPEPGGYPTVFVENFQAGSPDVTVIGYGGMSRLVLPLLESLAREEIKVLAVFPSSLKPLPAATLVDAAARSGRVVVVEEGTSGFDWGTSVATLLYDQLWKRLSRPIRRLASADSIIPTARHLEDSVLISTAVIEQAVLDVLQ